MAMFNSYLTRGYLRPNTGDTVEDLSPAPARRASDEARATSIFRPGKPWVFHPEKPWEIHGKNDVSTRCPGAQSDPSCLVRVCWQIICWSFATRLRSVKIMWNPPTPLGNVYITMESHHFWWENSTKNMVIFNGYVQPPESRSDFFDNQIITSYQVNKIFRWILEYFTHLRCMMILF